MNDKSDKIQAVFLDRDGTINADEHGYINKPEDLHLYPYAAEAISKLNKMGYLVFVVTNQAGVAYGYFKIEDVEKINAKFPAFAQKYLSEIMQEHGFEAKFDLQPVQDIHLKSHLINEIAPNADAKTLKFLKLFLYRTH